MHLESHKEAYDVEVQLNKGKDLWSSGRDHLQDLSCWISDLYTKDIAY